MGSPHNPSSPEQTPEQAMDRLLRRLLSEAGSVPKSGLAGGNPVGQILPHVSTQPTPGDPQGRRAATNCDWELVAAYAEGQLGRAEREKLEDHLAQCMTCRRMANAMLEERPDFAEAAEEKHAAGPWWLRWNWVVPALATALIVGSVVFYQRDQVLRPAAEDRTAARQVVEKGEGGQPAGRSSEASIPSHHREGAVVKSETGQPTEGQLPSASPSPGNKQAALSGKKEEASNIPARAPRAANAIAEPSDKAEAVQVLNSPPSPVAPPGDAPQAAQAPPAPRSPPAQYQQAIQPAADGGTARRDAEIAAGAGAAAVNAVGQMEERAAKALPQAAPLAAGAADSLDLAKKKTEAAPEGLRQTPAPKVAARSAAAPATPERDSETPLKPAPQSVTAPPPPGVTGGVIGGIAGVQPQAFSPLPGGAPLRSWMQHDSRLWAVSDGGRIFRSEDGGRTWRLMPSPTTQDLVSVKWDAAANSLLLEDKQGRQYHAEP